ncbi:MAG TPA: DNA primase [Syntrophorhabdaceae bacterium]|nr:DNA primase [Syntrophorhabdaceae bacterium]
MKASLDELLQRVNIIDVISPYVKLRKAGKDYMGLCPFHKEKTPSFTVSIEKQIYYCFGCREGGNAVNFLMKYENLTFVEAIEDLGRQYGIEVERKGDRKKTGHYDALSKLCEYYQGGLARAGFAREYLEKRGIGSGVIEEFRMGYSDRSRGALKNLLKTAGIPGDIFLSTGIVRMKDTEFYDMFAGRIVIPIIDVNKRIIGFGGRTLDKDGMPKYVNSPESSVFSKRSALFGIDKTKKHITDQDEVFIVEGYFDLITLYAGGLRNVVSTLGTSVTEGQISKLRNYTENITLMLDGDEAGIKSALRLIGLFAEMDINGNMVVLPEGHDPDSFIREKGIEGVLKTAAKKKPILDYYFDYCAERQDLGTVQGKQAFIRQVVPHIDAIRNGVKRRLYVKRLSELTGVEEGHFAGRGSYVMSEGPAPAQGAKGVIEKRVISACFTHPDLLEQFKEKEVLRYIKDIDVREVISKMVACFEEERCLEVRGFIEKLDKEALKTLVLDAVFDSVESGPGEPDKVLSDYFKHIEGQFFKEESKRITEKLADAEERGDDEAIAELLKQKRQVLTHIKNNFL